MNVTPIKWTYHWYQDLYLKEYHGFHRTDLILSTEYQGFKCLSGVIYDWYPVQHRNGVIEEAGRCLIMRKP